MTIKEFYQSTYPSDELGAEIGGYATFAGLMDVLHRGHDVYQYLQVYDSVLRERVFEQLAEQIHEDYEYVYKLWMEAE